MWGNFSQFTQALKDQATNAVKDAGFDQQLVYSPFTFVWKRASPVRTLLARKSDILEPGPLHLAAGLISDKVHA